MSDATVTLTLSAEQIARYYREGYLLVRGLATPERVAAVAAEARQVQVEPGGRWTPRIFDHQRPRSDRSLHQLLTDPRIVAAVEQVFEAPARVYYGMLAIVPAGGGTGLHWHQDNQYTQILGRALNVFVALDHITEDMALLWVSPGSHLRGLQPSESVDGHRKAADPGDGVQLPPMRPGDVCLFDRYTLHRSLSNTTDRHRSAYAAQYMEIHARMAQTGEKDPLRMTAADLATIVTSQPAGPDS